MLRHSPPGTRRTFLKQSSVALLAAGAGTGVTFDTATVAATDASISSSKDSKRCILLLMHGGPSQLETFDPKPQAPAQIRGPFGAISTAIPGLHFSETLPRLSQLADRFAIVRSLNWDGPAIHAVGMELLQNGNTGHLLPTLSLTQRINSAVGFPERAEESPLAMVINDHQCDSRTGNSIAECELISGTQVSSELLNVLPNLDSASVRSGSLAEKCLRAARLISRGTRFVTVDMFPKLPGKLSWDCHADGADLPTTLRDYRETICPEFDAGCARLLQELEEAGLLGDTLVVAVGEFGRSPRMNARGGREHWVGCWSALVAGGGVRGGAIVGESDAKGTAPIECPVSPVELFTLIRQHLGIPQNPSESCGIPAATTGATIGALANLFK